MKKVIIFLALVTGLSFSLTSCSDYLDSEYLFEERMSIDDVFSNKDYTNEWLARAYTYLGSNYMQDVCSKRRLPFNFADDMYFGDESDWYKKWKSGQYSEKGAMSVNDQSEMVWKTAYQGIKQASIFLENIDKNKLFTETEITDFKGQAHFLRAYFYWFMLRMYGPVPIIPDTGLDIMDSYDDLAYPRNSYDECVEYINDDLLKAASVLPLSRATQEVARPTRGAALALRAKVFLFAASPLYNGKAPETVAAALVNKDGKRLLPEAYVEEKWAKAAAAAKDVMGMNYDLYTAPIKHISTDPFAYPATIPPPDNTEFSDKDWPNGWQNIDPFESYRSVFNGTVDANANPELIFTRGQNQGSENIRIMVIHQLPRKAAGGYNSHGMTQKQCDAYYMADGHDCPGMNDMYIGRGGYEGRYNTTTPRAEGFVSDQDLANYPELGPLGVGVSKQYAAREPRFYASVGYNGSTWNLLKALNDDNHAESPNMQIFYYRGGTHDGYKSSSYWLRTGIGIKKYVHPDDISYTEKTSNDVSRVVYKTDPAIRYAEILLIYAEALNELTGSYEIPSWDGSKTHSISRDEAEMKKGIRPIRIRAGLPDYEEYGDCDKFRMKLKRERQIELFAEGHRYFDLRRWMDAPVEEAVPVYGCNVLATEDLKAQFHTPVMCTDLPTVFAEKMWFWPISHTELKHNINLVQNPGWTDPE